MTTAQAITELREKRGLSRQRFARRIGVTTKTVTALESGTLVPTGALGREILLALAVPEDDAIVALTIEVCTSLINDTVERTAMRMRSVQVSLH